jgi:hypothetical protein
MPPFRPLEIRMGRATVTRRFASIRGPFRLNPATVTLVRIFLAVRRVSVEETVRMAGIDPLALGEVP